MENVYVIVNPNDEAEIIQLVTNELSNGRYHIFNYDKNNVEYETFQSVEEAEKVFNKCVKTGRLQAWYKLSEKL